MTVLSATFATLRLLLAVVFAVSAFTKFADQAGFHEALANFSMPARLRAPVRVLIPVLELGIAITLLPALSAWGAAVGALVLLLVFTAAIVVNLVRGRRPDCHCFGQLSSAPVSWKTVLRNGALMAAAAVLIVSGRPANAGPSLVAWAGKLTLPEAIGVVAVGVIIAAVAIETWVLAHVLRQNGRLLLRMDALEASFARAGLQAAPSPPSVPTGPRAGLPVGTIAPAFRLDRLGGGTTTTAELLALGKPVALAFVDPGCGPCTALLPELARWERELADQATLALITTGSAEANHRKLAGLGLGHVLVQQAREASEAYRAFGTPSMVLVQTDGTIGSPVAAGRDAIHSLMARLAPGQHQPSDSRGLPGPAMRGGTNGATGRNGTRVQSRIGRAAPEICLPDLDGREVSLAMFRGNPTMVLFWNPGCGFCQRMLGDLKDWETSRSATSPQLLVVSSGSVEANRAMGLRAPVTLDVGFAAGRAFGAHGTPSAVLIDNSGRIASEMAVGAPAILELAAKDVTALGAGV
jgi:thiol-disulfide isomerase/thioredoxin